MTSDVAKWCNNVFELKFIYKSDVGWKVKSIIAVI